MASGKVVDVGALSRKSLWKEGLQIYLKRNLLLGYGCGNTTDAMNKYYGFPHDIHSSIVGPLVDTGPLGFILYIGGLLLTLFYVRKIANSRTNIAATAIYIYIFFSLLVHTVHFSKWFWIPLTMCSLLIEQDKREELEKSSLWETNDEMSQMGNLSDIVDF